jgi:4-hydroxybenzoate polyprenyltransferase
VNVSTALRLGRVSNLPTVWTNALAGFALATPTLGFSMVLGAIFGFSALYTAGMFLNDAFDVAHDRAHRPGRPIPSGDVEEAIVFRWGFALLAAGFAILAISARGKSSAVVAAAALAATIVFYDARHKDNAFGPALMGLCRALVYLTAGFSVGAPLSATLPAAGSTFCYLIGLTYLAKQEDRSGGFASWPLAMLAVPFLYAVGNRGGGLIELAAAVALLLVILQALRRLKSSTPAIGPAVGLLIAGISLVDAIFLASAGQPWLAFVAALCFLATLRLQHWVSGT